MKMAYSTRNNIEVAKDIEAFDDAHKEHIKAKVVWSTSNTDETMINLVGTWARMTRLINKMDDKYGEKR